MLINQKNLLRHLFSDDAFIGVRAGQPVAHMRSTNSKPQPSNQFPTDKIKLHPTYFLVREAVSFREEQQTITISISCQVFFATKVILSDF